MIDLKESDSEKVSDVEGSASGAHIHTDRYDKSLSQMLEGR